MNIDKGLHVCVNSDKFFLYFYRPATHESSQLMQLHLFWHTHDFIMSRINKGSENITREKF